MDLLCLYFDELDCFCVDTDSIPQSASTTAGFAFKDLDCLESLPDVVENLSQAQKQQAAEIERQHKILLDKKVRQDRKRNLIIMGKGKQRLRGASRQESEQEDKDVQR